MSKFVVKALPADDDDPQKARYWTGRMEGRWPEYLRNRDRAAELPKTTARNAAAEFNALNDVLTWSIEAVTE